MHCKRNLYYLVQVPYKSRQDNQLNGKLIAEPVPNRFIKGGSQNHKFNTFLLKWKTLIYFDSKSLRIEINLHKLAVVKFPSKMHSSCSSIMKSPISTILFSYCYWLSFALYSYYNNLLYGTFSPFLWVLILESNEPHSRCCTEICNTSEWDISNYCLYNNLYKLD